MSPVKEQAMDEGDVEWETLPTELWAMVCAYLNSGDLVQVSSTCWFLRAQGLSRVRHHSATCPGFILHRSGIKRALMFLASLPSLQSLDLSAWDILSDSMLALLPPGLTSLDLSYTSITNRGLARLPPSLTRLNLSHTTFVTGDGLRSLPHLVNLRELDFSHHKGLHVGHIATIPRTVERLNLSQCTATSPDHYGMSEIFADAAVKPAWPPQLKELKLRGHHIAMRLLYTLPQSLIHLDLSYCTLKERLIDMDRCLPQLQSLRMFNIYDDVDDSCGGVWSFPSRLKSLTLKVCYRYGSRTELGLLKHLPASITSLDLSHSRLSERVWKPECDAQSKEWLRELVFRLPRLKFLSLDPSDSYLVRGSDWKACPAWLHLLRERNVTIGVMGFFGVRQLLSKPPDHAELSTMADVQVVPREADPQWRQFIEACARQHESYVWVEPSPVPPLEDPIHEHEHDVEDDDDEYQDCMLFIGM